MFKVQSVNQEEEKKNNTSTWTENLQIRTKNEIAVVWPFVCSSFADLCISFDERKKIKEINASRLFLSSSSLLTW